MRRAAILCALTLIAAVLPYPALSAPAEVATVYRDSFGVPHITAPSQHALAYAMGFSLAEDRPFQLDLYRRAGEGRLAEILGEGENREFIDADILMRQEFFERSRIQAEIDAWDPDLRALWQAYANGINAGWAEVIADPSRSPVEFAALGYEPEPWTLIDSAAVTLQFTIVDDGGYGGAGELENAVFLGQLKSRFPPAEAEAVWDDTLWINDPDATPVIPDADAPPPPDVLTSPPDTPPPSQLAFLDLALPTGMAQAEDALLHGVVHDLALPKLGSYGVAIAPSQSASGNAMLLGAPQAGIAAPPLVWEVGMHAPGIDCVGAAVPGAGPFLIFGSCSHHAWTIVAGVAGDQVDVVVEQLSGDGYFYDDVVQDFEPRTELFLVRNTNPTSETAPEFRIETATFQRSRHGTVFSTDLSNSVAYVRKRSQEGHVLDNLASLFHLTEAQTFEEADDAVQEASWSVHITYADTEGNIAHWFTGRNPIHAAGLDLRLPTPGHSKAFEWAGFIPKPQNPHVRNPSQGFLVANQGLDSKPVGWWPSSDEWRIGRLERRGETEEIVRKLATEPGKVDLADIQRVNRLACCDIDPLVGFLTGAMREAVGLHPTPRRLAALTLLNEWEASGFARDDANGDGFYDAAALAIWAADGMPKDVYEGTVGIGPVWDGMYPLTYQDEIGGRPSIGDSQERLAPVERALRHARGLPTELTLSRDYFDNISTPRVETWDELLVAALDGGLNVLEARYETADMSQWKVRVNTIGEEDKTRVQPLGALAVRRVKGFDHSSYNFISEVGTCNGLSILPPGQGGPVSAADLLSHKSDGSYPPHYVDQLEMYERWEFKPLRLCSSQYLADATSERNLLIVKTAPNRPPNAVEDSVGTPSGTPITIEVLRNDYDPDGGALTLIGFTQAANGSLVKNDDGTMTYSPSAGFTGTDSFTYTVGDPEGLTDTATATVTVSPFCPFLPTGRFFDGLEPTPEPGWQVDTASNSLGPASLTWRPVTDAGARSPTQSFFSDATTLDVKDDRLVAPAQDLSPTSQLIFWHRFQFENNFDGGVLEVSTDNGSTWVDVLAGGGSFAEAGYDGTISPMFGSPIAGRKAWTSGSDDAAFGPMTKVVVNMGAFAGFDVRVRWRLAADPLHVGSTPGVGWWIDDVEFTHTLKLSNCNRPPVAKDDVSSTTKNTPVTINVLTNDSDPDGDPLTVVDVTPPGNGSAISNGGGFVTYAPSPDFIGTDGFTYTISDGRGHSDSAIVTVFVTEAPNRPPEAVDDTATTQQNTPVTINVLTNDSDPDGDPLTVVDVTPPGNGSAISNGGATVTYTPDGGFVGSDSFEYSISDGRGGSDAATVAVTVTEAPNLPPNAENDSATTVEGTPVTINVLANDSDPNGDPLTVVSLTDPPNGSATRNDNGTVTYTPDSGFVGQDTFTYAISDGRGGSDAASVTVMVNERPAPSKGKVTGAGWIPYGGGGERAHFGFNAEVKGGTVKGRIGYFVCNGGDDGSCNDEVGGISMKGNVQSLHISGSRAEFSGPCELPDRKPCRYTANVEDNGDPGADVDFFRIRIFDLMGGLLHEAGGWLGGGNIQIR